MMDSKNVFRSRAVRRKTSRKTQLLAAEIGKFSSANLSKTSPVRFIVDDLGNGLLLLGNL